MINVTTSEMHDILKMEGNKEYEQVLMHGTSQDSFDFIFNYISNSNEYELDEFRG